MMNMMMLLTEYDHEYHLKYESMAHFWTEWYSDYIKFEADNKKVCIYIYIYVCVHIY